MPENFANRYQTTLAAGVTSGALTGTVTTATGAPAVPFRAIISAEGANTDEIVLVTGRTGTTLTWTRAAEAIAGVQAASAHVSGATITAIVTAAGIGLIGPGWFNVKAEGAVGDGIADDTAAVAATIVKLTAGGTLYFPAGTYKTTGGFTIAVPCTIRGEGSAAWGNLEGSGSTEHVSQVTCTSPTAVLFTITSNLALFSNISLLNTSATTPTAGAGILVSAVSIGQRVDYDSIHVAGFYDDVSSEAGTGWTMRGCTLIAPVRYGLRVQNTVNADAGDWSISDCTLWSSKHGAAAGIRIESSGGGKIINCKINSGQSSFLFTHGIDITFTGATIGTGDYIISACSIENVSGNGINVVTATGANLYKLQIVGTQIDLLGTNVTGHAIVVNNSGGGNLYDVQISSCLLSGPGPVVAITLANCAATVSNIRVGGAFTAVYSNTGAVPVVDDTGTIGARVAITGVPVAGALPFATGTAAAAWARLAYDAKVKTNGSVSVTSTSFVTLDAALDITLTTGAHRVMIGWTLSYNNPNANDQNCVDVLLDGTLGLSGSAYGYLVGGTATASENKSLSGVIITHQMTAGAHTFSLVFRVTGGTAEVRATSGVCPLTFWAMEMWT